MKDFIFICIMCAGFVAFIAGLVYCHILWAQEQIRKAREMTVADLRKAIEKGRLADNIEQQKWFNYGLDYALKMLDVYADYQEPEIGAEYERITKR